MLLLKMAIKDHTRHFPFLWNERIEKIAGPDFVELYPMVLLISSRLLGNEGTTL